MLLQCYFLLSILQRRFVLVCLGDQLLLEITGSTGIKRPKMSRRLTRSLYVQRRIFIVVMCAAGSPMANLAVLVEVPGLTVGQTLPLVYLAWQLLVLGLLLRRSDTFHASRFVSVGHGDRAN